jgi:hypothetical protein
MKMNIMIDKIFKYGFFAVIVIAILAYVFKGIPGETKAYIEKLEEEKIELNENISRLEGDNRRIVTNIALKMDTIRILESDLAEIENKRIAAIKYYEKRIRNIDGLTVHGLDSLFAARYRFSSDTTEEDSN